MKHLFLKLAVATLLPFSLLACGSDDEPEVAKQEPVVENTATEQREELEQSPKDDDAEVAYMLPQTQSVELTAEQRGMVERGNDFSFDLYRAISADRSLKGRNIVASPLSVIYALGMLNDGAQGKTSDEIGGLLGYGSTSKAAIDAFCKKMMVEAPQVDPSVVLQIANIVIGNKDVEFEEQFKNGLQDNYLAEVASLDFSLPSSLDYINGWCNKKTEGMIPKILNELDGQTKMVLMNAIYFKATWSEQFDPKQTEKEQFFTEGKNAVLPMMHRRAQILYAQNDNFAAINLPYGGGDKWSMMVLLPNEGKTVSDVVGSLSNATWKELMGSMTSNIVDIKMPRFSTESDIPLNGIIEDLGAPSMFNPNNADFSPMTRNFKKADGKSLWVDMMKQKAAIEVAEEGTKLAATTVVMMEGATMAGSGTADFHANRPFVYVIREASSGAIFFVGTFQGK